MKKGTLESLHSDRLLEIAEPMRTLLMDSRLYTLIKKLLLTLQVDIVKKPIGINCQSMEEKLKNKIKRNRCKTVI